MKLYPAIVFIAIMLFWSLREPLWSPPANAEQAAEGLAHVYVNVVPNVVIDTVPLQPEDIIDISAGKPFSLVSKFVITANTDRLKLSCMASDLYRAAVSSSVDRIRVNHAKGCDIELPLANTLNGAPSRGVFDSDNPLDVLGFEAWRTNMIAFQSAQSGFSMPANLRVHYQPTLATLPQGQYGGVIKLIAILVE